ncbi:hypothetical protein CYMTET_28112 [Cymbomonas tetramitiformis]|uniref:Uncharacterized protein n=1 Tax=Cymbomonas tetramitiformis TaxID=36881 RepID=A0AAE0FNN3_9CHLO|nr:hypothetical protein CYMTET_28112 [Cymbomonas tetramitiformis]
MSPDRSAPSDKERCPLRRHILKRQRIELPTFNAKEFVRTYIYETLPSFLCVPICLAIEQNLSFLEYRLYIWTRENLQTTYLPLAVGTLHLLQSSSLMFVAYWLITDQLEGIQLLKCLITFAFAQMRVFNIAAKYAYFSKEELQRFHQPGGWTYEELYDPIITARLTEPMAFPRFLRELTAMEFADVPVSSFTFAIKDPNAAKLLRQACEPGDSEDVGEARPFMKGIRECSSVPVSDVFWVVVQNTMGKSLHETNGRHFTIFYYASILLQAIFPLVIRFAIKGKLIDSESWPQCLVEGLLIVLNLGYQLQSLTWITCTMTDFKRRQLAAKLLDSLVLSPGVPITDLLVESGLQTSPMFRLAEGHEMVNEPSGDTDVPSPPTVDPVATTMKRIMPDDDLARPFPMVHIDLRDPENIVAWTKLHISMRYFAPQFQSRMALFMGMLMEVCSLLLILSYMSIMVIKTAVELSEQSEDRKMLMLNEILSTEYERAKLISEMPGESCTRMYSEQLSSALSLMKVAKQTLTHMEHYVRPITIMGIEMGIGALGSTVGIIIAGVAWSALVYLEKNKDEELAYQFNQGGRYTN